MKAGSFVVQATTFVATFILSSSVTVFAAGVGAVNDSGVNVRAMSNTGSEVVMTVDTGHVVKIDGVENGFFKVSFGEHNGVYIKDDYVTVVEAEGIVNDTGVNVRDSASTDAGIITKANTGDVFTVTERKGDWYAVNHSGTTAYIHKDFIIGDSIDYVKKSQAAAPVTAPVETKVETPVEPTVAIQAEVMAYAAPTVVPDGFYAVVASDTGLNLRTDKSQQATVAKLLSPGDCLDIYSISDGWAKVSYYGTEGYVSEEFIELKTGEKPEKPQPVILDYNTSKGEQIIAYGKKFLGTPYVWAGTDLTSGVDCSGFVYSVMRDNGVKLNRSSSAMASNGQFVPKEQLQAGDLVLFANDGSTGISHVGIYMGGGDFIHSSSNKRTWGVTISNLGEDYYIRNYVTARRVVS